MTNEILWACFLIFDFLMAIFLIKTFGRMGLYAIVITGIITCNLQVLKLVEIFGFIVSLGNIAYGSIFLATDLLSECYGRQEARKAVGMGLCAMLFFTIATQVCIMMAPSVADQNHSAMAQLFALSPRIAAGSLIAYIISQYHDIAAFDYWKKATKGKHLWLRNNLSTGISQLLDTAIFVVIAFWGALPNDVVASIFLSTLFFKWVVAILDTPIVYLGRYLLTNRSDFKEVSFKDSDVSFAT